MSKIGYVIITKDGSSIEIGKASEKQIRRLIDTYIDDKKQEIGFKKRD